MTKYDRHGYHARQRVIIVTDQAVYMVNEKDFKMKEKLLFTHIKSEPFIALGPSLWVVFEPCLSGIVFTKNVPFAGISTSTLNDGFLVIHTKSEANGNKVSGRLRQRVCQGALASGDCNC